jgi:hypothetical protein
LSPPPLTDSQPLEAPSSAIRADGDVSSPWKNERCGSQKKEYWRLHGEILNNKSENSIFKKSLRKKEKVKKKIECPFNMAGICCFEWHQMTFHFFFFSFSFKQKRNVQCKCFSVRVDCVQMKIVVRRVGRVPPPPHPYHHHP